VVYKKGLNNKAADALSRRHVDVSQCYALSTFQPQWIEQVVNSYLSNQFSQEVLTKLAVDGASYPPYTLHQGLLRYNGKLWIGADPNLKLKLLFALHDSPVGGHLGFVVTYRMMKKLLAWKDMKIDIKEYVQACMVCQQAMPDRKKSHGLL
jgi:hypothetical protein